MPYVQYDGSKVIGAFANPQPGFAEAFLPDDDPAVLAFLNPPRVPSCLVWQLEAHLSPAQWSAVQAFIAGSGNQALIAFASHGTNPVPANSTTLAALAGVAGIDPATLPALVEAASKIAIP